MPALAQEKIYTINDIYALPDGERAELIDGQIYTHTSHTQTTPETVYFKEFSSENSHAACAKPLATDKTLCK